MTNKKYTYFQNEDLYKTVNEDSIYRSYKIPEFTYKLQASDIISIKFYSLTDKDLNFFVKEQVSENVDQIQSPAGQLVNGYLIDNDGKISLPVVGKVDLSGLTITEAESKLKKIAKQYIKEPVVEVRLLNYRFTILGEVAQPGTYSTYNYAVSIPEALGIAGGLNDLASKNNIKIIRRLNSNTNVVFYVDLLNEDFFNSSKYYIFSNDIIVVSPLQQRPYRKYFSENVSVFISSLSLILIVLNYLN